jgi:hypothetical protein
METRVILRGALSGVVAGVLGFVLLTPAAAATPEPPPTRRPPPRASPDRPGPGPAALAWAPGGGP